MGNYRVTNPIPVMVREVAEGTAFVSSTVPKGAIISVEGAVIDLAKYIFVKWNGEDALMFAGDLLIHAERASEVEK
jgi:hypothetical protein